MTLNPVPMPGVDQEMDAGSFSLAFGGIAIGCMRNLLGHDA
jgi:hypothetical protein